MSDKKTYWKERGRESFNNGEEIFELCPMTAPANSWFREGWKEAEAEFLENEKEDRDRITDEERELMKEEEGYEPEQKLKVVPLQESNYRDIVATLRVIADQIESGEYGNVNDAALVIQGTTFDIFHMGKGDVETAHLILACAQRKLELAAINHYDQE